MSIKSTNPLAFARALSGRCFLSLHTRVYTDKTGSDRNYFMCTRGEKPKSQKNPDAVVIVAFHNDGNETRLILVDEYRVPIDCREISFPAGLIDESDYKTNNSIEAAKNASIRELHEETGYNFTPIKTSPPNLYSSAGMTDESVCVVMGKATGESSTINQEASEDIKVISVNLMELKALLEDSTRNFSKVAWPLLWAFQNSGFPDFEQD